MESGSSEEIGADFFSDDMLPQAKKMMMSFLSLGSEQRVISSADKIADKLTPEHSHCLGFRGFSFGVF